jgi:hypothetical protein
VTSPHARLGKNVVALVAFALFCGALLRLVFPDDIHYLADEAWTFRHVQDARNGDAWASLGMPSSRGVKNPGMSVWVFIVLGALSGASTPSGLTRAVAVLALVAHAAALAIPLWAVRDERDRRAWTWAIVLSLSNPILVFLERKIWAQSVLPIFMVGLFVGWLRRETRAGAFAWGLLGAVVPQIHMAGFFFVPALALWTRLFSGGRDRRDPGAPKTRWLAWLLGSAAGSLFALRWVVYVLRERPPAAPSAWWLRFRLEFYQYFFSDPSGLCGEYVLGRDVLDAMRYPLVFGHATYLVAAAHVAMAIASVALAQRALHALWERRKDLATLARGDGTDTGVLLAATIVGMGGLMTLPSIAIHRHYMLATFPLQYVFAARVALRKPKGERWLAVLFAGGIVVSMGFLAHVRTTGENQEMGKTYATQLREGIPPEAAKRSAP